MESARSLRLLPWSSPDGKPCFLAAADGGGYVSRRADEVEARQLADGLDVLLRARRVLEDPMSPQAEVRYAAIRLTECLADVLRVADSRGRRLPSPAGAASAAATAAVAIEDGGGHDDAGPSGRG
ncbi:hypothetical protein [Streptomyces zingiberis]|uniref:hypothetical protein n=1 Tax=Streptomyces zingiberis TaxID=2053010 RepID=UPI001F0F2DE0|nr:hypothetical protein [Streptomyces zingiberis]